MNLLKDLKALHHAYLIEAAYEEIQDELLSAIEKELRVRTKANPDFQLWRHETFGIDESRKLKEAAVLRPTAGRQMFVICFSSMTREAQNALLKLLEEPIPNTHFLLVSPQVASLLPTLRSRLYAISLRSSSTNHDDAKEFLGANSSTRTKIIGDLAVQKDRAKALRLLGGIEVVLYERRTTIPNVYRALAEVATLRRYLHDRGSSIKLILEHIALTAPFV